MAHDIHQILHTTYDDQFCVQLSRKDKGAVIDVLEVSHSLYTMQKMFGVLDGPAPWRPTLPSTSPRRSYFDSEIRKQIDRGLGMAGDLGPLRYRFETLIKKNTHSERVRELLGADEIENIEGFLSSEDFDRTDEAMCARLQGIKARIEQLERITQLDDSDGSGDETDRKDAESSPSSAAASSQDESETKDDGSSETEPDDGSETRCSLPWIGRTSRSNAGRTRTRWVCNSMELNKAIVARAAESDE